jgi:uncharacterized protein (UPF0248 family)
LRIKEIINKVLFKYKDSLNQYMLVIIDRKCSSRTKYLSFELIKHVDNYYIYVESEDGREVAIPIHRVIRIEKRGGEIVWSRT